MIGSLASRNGATPIFVLALGMAGWMYGCSPDPDRHPYTQFDPPDEDRRSDDEEGSGGNGLGGTGASSGEAGAGGESGLPPDGDPPFCEADGCPETGTCDRVGDLCGENGFCVDVAFGSVCACEEGYYLGQTECLDIFECELSVCASAATCFEKPGGFECRCPKNTFGDGLFCLEEDPCASESCGAFACEPVPWGAVCLCPQGLRGPRCEEICGTAFFADEALTNLVLETLDVSELPTWGSLAFWSSLSTSRLSLDEIHSLSGMECWQGLRSLDLYGQAVSDVAPLSELHFLEEIDLGCTPVRNLEPLSKLYRLEWLALDQSQCARAEEEDVDLSPLSNLLQLREISVSGLSLDSFVPLTNLPRLTTLVAEQTKVPSFAPVGEFVSLERLSLAGSDVSAGSSMKDFHFLSSLTSLSELNLSRTEFSDLGVLAALDRLTSLSLSENHLKDAALQNGLTFMKRVSMVDLSFNQLTKLPKFGVDVLVSELNVWGNDIASLKGVDEIKFAPGARLFVGANSLDCAAEKERLSVLKERGVAVFADCP